MPYTYGKDYYCLKRRNKELGKFLGKGTKYSDRYSDMYPSESSEFDSNKLKLDHIRCSNSFRRADFELNELVDDLNKSLCCESANKFVVSHEYVDASDTVYSRKGVEYSVFLTGKRQTGGRLSGLCKQKIPVASGFDPIDLYWEVLADKDSGILKKKVQACDFLTDGNHSFDLSCVPVSSSDLGVIGDNRRIW